MVVKKKTNNNRPDRGANRKSGNVKPTAEETRALLAKQLKLKPKTKAMLDDLIDNPKMTQREAYLKYHKTTNMNTVDRALNRTMNKPSVIGYKDAAVNKAKRRIVSLVDSENENTALKASQDIIDRNEGKAIQKNETVNRTVEVKLDLTGVKIGSHYLTPPQAQAIADGIAES